jgi:ribosomal protein S18 acetylase RimI-like enzyme
MMSDGSLTLEPVRPADEAALLAMARDFHAEDGHDLTAAGARAVRALCVGDPMALAWFLCLGGARVGYAVLSFGFSVEHGGRDGFIDDLYLVPSARGRGLGKAAMDAVERVAAACGVQALHLEVARDNRRAEALYRARGYRVTDRQLMSKRLAP